MATKPTKQPEWASGGGAAITEPSSGKKSLGWVAEKPPHQFFNWLQNIVYKWTLWLERAQTTTIKAMTNWRHLGSPIKSLQDLVWGGGSLVMVVGKHDTPSWLNAASISTDGGLTWTNSNPFGGVLNVFVSTAAWNGSVWVAGGQGGNLATSPDGITWTTRTSGIGGTIYSVVWSSTLSLFVASDGTNIITSPTGVTWTLQSAVAGGQIAENGAGLLVSWAAVAGTIYTSTNGTTWTLQPTNLPTLASPSGMRFAGGYFWIFRQNPLLTVLAEKSTDGVTWTSVTNLPANISGMYGPVANQHTIGQDGIIVVGGFANVGPDGSGGSSPAIMYSADAGATWFVNYYTHSLGLVVGLGSMGMFSPIFVGDYDHFMIAMSGGLFITPTMPIEFLP